MGCGPSKGAHASVEPLLGSNNNNKRSSSAETSTRPTSPIIDKNTSKAIELQRPQVSARRQTSGISATPKPTHENTTGRGTNNHYDRDNNNSNNTGTNNAVPYSNGAGPFHNNHNGAAQSNLPTTAGPKGSHADNNGSADLQWKELWWSHKDILLDPADVHATLQDLMANATNRFSDTELLFLQRRVRSIVRQSRLQTEQQIGSNGGKNRKKGRLRDSGSSGNLSSMTSTLLQKLLDTTTVAKNRHLLTPHVLRKALPPPPVPMVRCNMKFLLANFIQTSMVKPQSDVETTTNGTAVDGITAVSGVVGEFDEEGFTNARANNGSASTAIRIVETTYLLALFCNDVLWDDVAAIAVDSAKVNSLETDVNKMDNDSKDTDHDRRSASSNNTAAPAPTPPSPTCDRPSEVPPGMGMHALTFILGLALRKY